LEQPVVKFIFVNRTLGMIHQPSVSVKQMPVKKVTRLTTVPSLDTLSVEEPLEIRIVFGPGTNRVQKVISVTMRTPGHDAELALGFLFTEGIISSYRDVVSVSRTGIPQQDNVVCIELAESFNPHLAQADRNFYMTSSCGLCGKKSIQSIKTVSAFNPQDKPSLSVSAKMLYTLPATLRVAQRVFAETGGIHASGLFTSEGDLVVLREDVGRHNALDKVVGNAIANNLLPLNRHILLLSGRASFELIQKAAMAGISVVAAIGAPSSLAVELAAEFDMTLLGFLRHDRFNIYTSSHHTLISTADK